MFPNAPPPSQRALDPSVDVKDSPKPESEGGDCEIGLEIDPFWD